MTETQVSRLQDEVAELQEEVARLRSGLQKIFEDASKRRKEAADYHCTVNPNWEPYGTTPDEAWRYWLGVRNGLMGINVTAYDVLNHGKDVRAALGDSQ